MLVVTTLMVASASTDDVAWSSARFISFDRTGVHNLHKVLTPRVNDLGDDRIVTAGLGVKTAETSAFILRSYDARTGSLVSENQFELTLNDDSEAEIEAGGGRVYAVGSGLGKTGRLSLLVRAYDASTGELLWEDELNRQEGPDVTLTAAVASSSSGRTEPQPIQGSQPVAMPYFTVQSIDAETGKIVWQDDFLPGVAPDQEIRKLSFEEGALVERDFSIQVRTFDPETGAFLWEDLFYPEGLDDAVSENGAGMEEFFLETEDTHGPKQVKHLDPCRSSESQLCETRQG